MKRISMIIMILVVLSSQAINLVEAKNTYRPKSSHSYISGPRGGCYYWNSNGNKTYVDRDLCR